MSEAFQSLVRADSSADPVQILSYYGKSFRWAGCFLPKNVFLSAAIVYAYCRRLDDHIDENILSTIQEKKQWLQNEKKKLEKIFQTVQKSSLEDPKKDLSEESSQIENLFVILQAKSSLGLLPCFEMMQGMKKDLDPVRIQNLPELLEYCYQVAGTVGLMMCPVLEVQQQKAYPFAVDLGIAMQIYNICRDVPVDAEMDRIYLPMNLLDQAGLSSQDLKGKENPPDPEKLKPVMQYLLSLADQYYESGMKGLVFIPWYARWGIAVAATVYRGIGQALIHQNYNPYQKRASTSLSLKILFTMKAFLFYLKTLFQSVEKKHRLELHASLKGKPGCDGRGTDLSVG